MADEVAAETAPVVPGTTVPTTIDATTTSRVAVDVSQIPDEALKDRLDRHARKTLADTFGVKTPEEAKAMRAKLAKYEADEATATAAAMSEQEKMLAALSTERAQRAHAEAELQTERETNALMQVLHAKGVKNVDYARFLLDKAKREAGEGVQVDIASAMSEALGDPLTRAALGIVDEVVAPGVPPKVGATTSPSSTVIAPKPPTGTSPANSSAKAMNDKEWQAYKRSVGLI